MRWVNFIKVCTVGATLVRFLSFPIPSRPEDLHPDAQRPPGARRPLGAPGILFLREAELRHRVHEEQRVEPGQEQPGETLPLSGTPSHTHTHTGHQTPRQYQFPHFNTMAPINNLDWN